MLHWLLEHILEMRRKRPPIRLWTLFRRGNCVYRYTLASASEVEYWSTAEGKLSSASGGPILNSLLVVSVASACVVGLSTAVCLVNASLSESAVYHHDSASIGKGVPTHSRVSFRDSIKNRILTAYGYKMKVI